VPGVKCQMPDARCQMPSAKAVVAKFRRVKHPPGEPQGRVTPSK
jgi:hypothetical protein